MVKKEVVKKTTKKQKKLITGRRKEAVAKVELIAGKGRIKVNSRSFEEYFPIDTLRLKIVQPLVVAGVLDKFNVCAWVNGGGISGQAGALSHGIARALVEKDENLRPLLKKEGLLRRDPRQKERKKYGQKGARKKFQFSKR